MMAKRRQTLQQRVISRWEKEKFKQWDSALAILNIRAEFDRLARAVRKELNETVKLITPMVSTRERDGLEGRVAGYEDVLDLIKEQKR